MAELKLSPTDAANLLIESRDPITEHKKKSSDPVPLTKSVTLEFANKTISSLAKVTTKDDKVGAALTSDLNILIVTGSRVPDYGRYNLRPNRTLSWQGDEEKQIKDLTKPWRLKDFHSGFVLHAARVLKFLDGHVPDFIIGHSLGAASAQILGNHLNVPTICLASPQVIKQNIIDKEKMREPSNEQWKILNIAWKQDTVTSILRPLKYRCLGHRVVFQKSNLGMDHFVKQYRDMIKKAEKHQITDADGNPRELPKKWHSTELPIKEKS
ncbi:MAG: hypothetical protein AAGJ34_10655 [Pseudomonadota bacterium]